MSDCCEECKSNHASAVSFFDTLEQSLEGTWRNLAGMRVGTADCDVNPLILDREKGEAIAALELAMNKLMTYRKTFIGGLR